MKYIGVPYNSHCTFRDRNMYGVPDYSFKTGIHPGHLSYVLNLDRAVLVMYYGVSSQKACCVGMKEKGKETNQEPGHWRFVKLALAFLELLV